MILTTFPSSQALHRVNQFIVCFLSICYIPISLWRVSMRNLLSAIKKHHFPIYFLSPQISLLEKYPLLRLLEYWEIMFEGHCSFWRFCRVFRITNYQHQSIKFEAVLYVSFGNQKIPCDNDSLLNVILYSYLILKKMIECITDS